ncbi:MAG: hypothetical protein CMJ78_25475 [Planctomycetaceae bacterium]|nr:hypothetical protein [Planctomycetaceae bacterium]
MLQEFCQQSVLGYRNPDDLRPIIPNSNETKFTRAGLRIVSPLFSGSPRTRKLNMSSESDRPIDDDQQNEVSNAAAQNDDATVFEPQETPDGTVIGDEPVADNLTVMNQSESDAEDTACVENPSDDSETTYEIESGRGSKSVGATTVITPDDPVRSDNATVMDDGDSDETGHAGSTLVGDDDESVDGATLMEDGTPNPEHYADQTIVEDGGDFSCTIAGDATVMDDGKFAGQSPNPDATLMDPGLANQGASGQSETIVDAAAQSPFAADHETDDATIVQDGEGGSGQPEATLMDPGLAATSPPPTDDGTVIQSDSVTSDATVYEGDGPPPEQDDATIVQAAEEDPDATVLGEHSQNGDVDGAVIENSGAVDPNATVIDSQADSGSGRKSSGGDGRFQHGQQRYDLKDNFARGGLGNIWLAHDESLHRDIAYKELLPRALRNPAVKERFLEEAQITGQLEHPGIVPIYDIGYQHNGAPYYAMKLVRGDTLENEIEAYHAMPHGADRDLKFKKLLQNFIDVCNALAFAHDRGVLHRDLKPLNVMLGAFGETLVLDWGLAKVLRGDLGEAADADIAAMAAEGDLDAETVLDNKGGGESPSVAATVQNSQAGESQTRQTTTGGDSSGHTKSGSTTVGGTRQSVMTDVRSESSQTMMGSVMGTPVYMPPEQASGAIDKLDATTDIYSLGGILYKLLTNHQPIAKGRVKEVIERVKNNEIIPPHEHDASIPKPLAAICMKAMAKEQADRYSTALALAADVEAWLGDQPVSCHEDSAAEKLGRWIRHNTTLATSIALSFILIVGGTAAWYVKEDIRVSGLSAKAQRQIAEARLAMSTEEFDKAENQLNEALGGIESEESLALLAESIKELIVEVDQAREAKRRSELQKQLDDYLNQYNVAETQFKQENYSAARDELNALSQSLADNTDSKETVFAGVRTDVAVLLVKATKAEAALPAYNEFLEKADEIRFLGNAFGDLETDLPELKKLAADALSAYGLGEQADESVFAEKTLYLSPDRQKTIKETAFEIYLLLADAETLLARADPDNKAKHLTASINGIARAESFGDVPTKSLHLRRSYVYSLLGDDQSAKESEDIADGIKPTSAMDFFLVAETIRKQGNYSEARKYYLRVMEHDSGHFWAHQYSGFCSLMLSQAEAAINSFNACIAMREDFGWVYMMRGLAYAEMRDIEHASEDFETAMKLGASKVAVHSNFGAFLAENEQYDLALDELSKAEEIAPEHPKVKINIAETNRKLGTFVAGDQGLPAAQKYFDLALKKLDEAEAINPNNAAIYRIRALTLSAIGETQKSTQEFQKAIDIDTRAGRKADSLKSKALSLFSLEKLDDALTSIDESLDLVDYDGHAHAIRGFVLNQIATNRQKQGDLSGGIRDFEAAEASFTRALDNGFVNSDIYRTRGLVRGMQNKLYPAVQGLQPEDIERYERKYRLAVNDYTLSIERQPSVNMLRRRGWAYIMDYERLAFFDFDQAISLYPFDADSLGGRGYIYALQGNIPAAVKDAAQSRKEADTQYAEWKINGRDYRSTWQLYYNISNIYVLATLKAAKQPNNQAAITEYSNQAIANLARCAEVAEGQYQFTLLRSLLTDESFAPYLRAFSSQVLVGMQPHLTETLEQYALEVADTKIPNGQRNAAVSNASQLIGVAGALSGQKRAVFKQDLLSNEKLAPLKAVIESVLK